MNVLPRAALSWCGLGLAVALAGGRQAQPAAPIQFADVTAAAGVTFRHNSGAFGKKYLPETMGSGVAVLDVDGDGWQDILFVRSMNWPGRAGGKSIPALYRNNHNGTFTDITREAGLAVEMYGLGVTAADYDNDGRVDIYITALGQNHLFRNLGGARFEDVTAKAGVADRGFSTSAAWLDYDRDGRLDLFVGHYVDWTIEHDLFCTLNGRAKSYCTPESYQGQSPTLFHNNGDGTFDGLGHLPDFQRERNVQPLADGQYDAGAIQLHPRAGDHPRGIPDRA